MDRSGAGAALRWLAHPVSVSAIAVLVLNDHVLKPAFASWWTGKVSDVAGLVFAPALLGVALGAVPRCRRLPLVPTCVLAVGVVFAMVKVTTWGAAAASAAWSVVDGPSHVLADPTDLLALPALAVAWHVGRLAIGDDAREASGGRGARTRAAALARWGLVLPCPVLATAATAAPLDPTADAISADRDGVAVVVDGAVYYGGTVRLTTADGVTWTEEATDESPAPESTLSGAATGAQGDPVCAPAAPDVCYRPMSGHLGVERSDDGGITWSTDWSVPDDVREVLARRYLSHPDPEQLRTLGVAVLEVGEGHVVVAANGRDGVAVRHEDGSWERLGFVGCCDEPGQTAVVALPGTPEELLVPAAAAWPAAGAAAAGLTFVVLALVLPERRPRAPRSPLYPAFAAPVPVRADVSSAPSRPSRAVRLLLVVASLALCALAARSLVPSAAAGQVDTIEALTEGTVLALAPTAVVAVLLVVAPRLRRAGMPAIGGALGVGLLVAVVVGATIG